jgi:restriction system protein
MKLLNENSLFAVLLRQPWWVSLLAAGGAFMLMKLFLPAPYAAFGAAPFIVIAGIAAWRQLRMPSAKRVAARLEVIRGMSREEFVAALDEAFRREGYEVARAAGAHADLELTQAGRVSLVSCRRWKATRTGIEPLRGLLAEAQKREVGCMYVAAGEVTANARAFAARERIRLVDERELARLLRNSGSEPRKAEPRKFGL